MPPPWKLPPTLTLTQTLTKGEFVEGQSSGGNFPVTNINKPSNLTFLFNYFSSFYKPNILLNCTFQYKIILVISYTKMSPKFHIGCGKKQKKKTKKTHCKYFIMTHLKYSQWVPIPAGNLMFKVNNRNSRTRCEIRSAGFELAVRNSRSHFDVLRALLRIFSENCKWSIMFYKSPFAYFIK